MESKILEQILPYPLMDKEYSDWKGKRVDMPEHLRQLEKGYHLAIAELVKITTNNTNKEGSRFCSKCSKAMDYHEPAWAWICNNGKCEFFGIHQQGIANIKILSLQHKEEEK